MLKNYNPCKQNILLLINNKGIWTMSCWIFDFETCWFSGASRGYKMGTSARNGFLRLANKHHHRQTRFPKRPFEASKIFFFRLCRVAWKKLRPKSRIWRGDDEGCERGQMGLRTNNMVKFHFAPDTTCGRKR